MLGLTTANRWWRRWPNLRGEHGGAGSNAPAHHRLADPALPDALADLVLLHAANLCFQAQMTDELQSTGQKTTVFCENRPLEILVFFTICGLFYKLWCCDAMYAVYPQYATKQVGFAL